MCLLYVTMPGKGEGKVEPTNMAGLTNSENPILVSDSESGVGWKEKGRCNNGRWISRTAMVLGALLVAAVFVAVILAVYFGHPDYGKSEMVVEPTTRK